MLGAKDEFANFVSDSAVCKAAVDSLNRSQRSNNPSAYIEAGNATNGD
jgi:hypothetical protein